jgi:hypothetical protein
MTLAARVSTCGLTGVASHTAMKTTVRPTEGHNGRRRAVSSTVLAAADIGLRR